MMTKIENNETLQTVFYVSIVLERQRKQVKQWVTWDWSIAGVVVGKQSRGDGENCVLLREDNKRVQYLHRNMRLELFKDGCEGYWYNLTSEKASLFLVCDVEDAAMAKPLLITANQDEALAHMESDELVLSTSIPAEIYHPIEAFVIVNYLPATKKKRKRRDWARESDYAKRQEKS